ncbi:hypothetical protein [Nocardioides sp. zg-DK7169]|uniref:hypothetical protein n=1 Tax=Nocardioides sp. zg-DK7169 TaxID=2736600 RepID=UPI001557BEC7|nr:hypothetical protein [Nocardioides sp. zg-DK7169]NPC96333.1 hypothetical protein [Nocardioides sp. zg-DK7169]
MDPVTGLSCGRIVLGAASLLRPDVAANAFRLDLAANPQLSYVLRLFGAREVALGAVTLLAPAPARRALLATGVAVDVADVATAVQGAREGHVARQGAFGLAGPAAGAVLIGLLALRRPRG